MNKSHLPDSTFSVQERTILFTALSQITDQQGASIAFDALQIGDFVSLKSKRMRWGLLVATQINRDEAMCDGIAGDDTYENLEVPEGATCRLVGTNIQGNLVINASANLVASGITVGGNIQSVEPDSITVNGTSAVGGNMQIRDAMAVEIQEVTIDGDLQLELNDGLVMAVRSVVGGNLQATQNLGGVVFNLNQIAENMQCSGNNPMPTGAGIYGHLKRRPVC